MERTDRWDKYKDSNTKEIQNEWHEATDKMTYEWNEVRGWVIRDHTRKGYMIVVQHLTNWPCVMCCLCWSYCVNGLIICVLDALSFQIFLSKSVVYTWFFFSYLSIRLDSLVFYLGLFLVVLGLSWFLYPPLLLQMDTKTLFDFWFPWKPYSWRNSYFRRPFVMTPRIFS